MPGQRHNMGAAHLHAPGGDEPLSPGNVYLCPRGPAQLNGADEKVWEGLQRMAGYRGALIAVDGLEQPSYGCRVGYRCVVPVFGDWGQSFVQARRNVEFAYPTIRAYLQIFPISWVNL